MRLFSFKVISRSAHDNTFAAAKAALGRAMKIWLHRPVHRASAALYSATMACWNESRQAFFIYNMCPASQ